MDRTFFEINGVTQELIPNAASQDVSSADAEMHTALRVATIGGRCHVRLMGIPKRTLILTITEIVDE